MWRRLVFVLAFLIPVLLTSEARPATAPQQVCTVAGSLQATRIDYPVHGYQWSLTGTGVCTQPNAVPRPTTISGRLANYCYISASPTLDIPYRLLVGLRIGNLPNETRLLQYWDFTGPAYPLVAHRITVRRAGEVPSCSGPTVGPEYGIGGMVGAPTAKHLDTLTLQIFGSFEHSWKVSATFAFEA